MTFFVKLEKIIKTLNENKKSLKVKVHKNKL